MQHGARGFTQSVKRRVGAWSPWPVRDVVVRYPDFWWRRCSLVVRPNVLRSGFVGEQRCKRWSEEEVVGFDNSTGESWKVSMPLQRISSPSRVEEVLPSPPRLPAPPSMFTMAAPGSLARVWWSLGNQTRDTAREHCKCYHTGADHKNTARTIHWCTHPSTLQTRGPEQVEAGHAGWRTRWRHQSVPVQMWRTVTASISLLRLDAKPACLPLVLGVSEHCRRQCSGYTTCQECKG